MTQIAILGTGLLGGGLAQAAAKRGDTVVAWNRTQQKLQALAAHGVSAAASPADAVRNAKRIHLVLKDDAVVEDVIGAARPGLSADAVLIDHSTTLPAATAERSRRLAAQGIAYLHCPVFMTPLNAREAQGSMLAAGPQALFDRVSAELARMTGRLSYLGERPDLAAVHKLMGNAMLMGLVAVTADVFAIGRENDVPATDALRLLEVFDLKAILAGRGANMAKGNFNASFELTMARKDVGLMLQAAGQRPLAALPAIAARMDQLIASGHGADDASVLGIDETHE